MSGGLAITSLTGGYPKREVIHDLTVAGIAAGEVVALVGPNAAGKSTLLRMIAGIVPASGSVRLGGAELMRMSFGERARQVAFMPQILPAGMALSVLEGTIAALRATPTSAGFLPDAEAKDRAAATLERLGILDLALRSYDRLSGGQRQLASLAQAVVRQPRLLLLDEPTSALDLAFQLRVMGFVRELARERRLTVIVVLHDLNLACRWADRIAVLSDGRLVAFGLPREAVTRDLLRTVYAVEARIAPGQDGQPMVEVLAEA